VRPSETRWGRLTPRIIRQKSFRLIRWRRALTADAASLPTEPDITGVRRFLWAEVVVFAFIPAFAAAMARGYGALVH
jgi:putative membrane protein